MIKWIVPDSDELRHLNMWMLDYNKMFKQNFWDNSCIFAVYGVLHDTVFSGGRVTSRETKLSTEYGMRNALEQYISRGCEYRFVFTQGALKPEMLYDFWGNLQLKLAEEYDCKVIVASDILENYIREKYPKIGLVSSTTKMIGGSGSEEQAIIDEFNKDYDTVVLNTRYNFNYDFIPVELRHKAEVLINDCCPPFCVRRKYCYNKTMLHNVGQEWRPPGDHCNNDSKKDFLSFAGDGIPRYTDLARSYLCHYSIDDIFKAHEAGIEKFKFGGRELSNIANLLERAEYMVKPEAKADFIVHGIVQTKMLNEKNQQMAVYVGD